MRMELLWLSARSATVALEDGGLYRTMKPWRLFLNGEDRGDAHTVVRSLFGLRPDTPYRLWARGEDGREAALEFVTKREYVTLDVRAFGAFGDGAHDDTPAIQAAIACCPPESRVLVPPGRYLTSPLFLKSRLRLEIAAGAELLLQPGREHSPILPGLVESFDERGELNLGSWEGNPLDSYAALLTGVGAEDVEICGEGVLDGQGRLGDWWEDIKRRRGAWRGRLLFLNRCQNVTVQGLAFRDSPAWTLHPYFSKDLRFLNISAEAPADSPNTDGFDPESCADVFVAGARFSVGDDCIAVKSGKLWMGEKYRTPCERLTVAHCLMENGHGGVTIGSEMSGGVRDIVVRDCLMRKTDRGLRVKTRRGRGEQGVVDNVVFERVRMEGVASPLVINCFYHCDPDGHSAAVQSREAPPAGPGTPSVGTIVFRNVRAEGCRQCAAFLLGLPERKPRSVTIEDASFSFAADAESAPPAMADGVAPCAKRGVIAENVEQLTLRRVAFEGIEGEPVEARGVDRLEMKGTP